MKWPEIVIETPHGRQTAIAPLVISASRATDIPAFHADWFMHRLRAGYCVWQNPFNARQRQYVSFERAKVVVFWSKHPAALMPYLSEIKGRGYEFYFQYTLNDYEQAGLEPGLPRLSRRMEQFRRLSEQVGKQRVIWRFDPVILGGGLTIDDTLDRLYAIGREIAPYTEKLVFSFVDWYKKTERELGKIDARLRAPSEEEMRQIAQGIVEVERALPSRLKLATCAESIDLHRFGIEHNQCIDSSLLLRLCPDCVEFQKAYGKSAHMGQGSLLALSSATLTKAAKDSGQRTPCGCVPSKDIGTYNTCRHFCTYCYANQSQNAVLAKLRTLRKDSEQL
ncbi:DUF1848 domain-containing protein [Desulfovibrio sp.]|uniref:DUF1848 domain-containing protein n=1 Tax=Desulfovibrio sp. TaxID=885 RepID=UPI003AB50F0E